MPSLIDPSPGAETENSAKTEAHVQEVLQSLHFSRAETLRKLLSYLWEHRGEVLSEYAIATEALGRSAHFDSTADASVRVQISRLRRKLKEYYIQETAGPELLQIPMGTHQLIIVEGALGVPPGEEDQAPSKVHWLSNHGMLLLGAACLVLAIAVVWLARIDVQLRGKVYGADHTNTFWANFLAGDAPVNIILPTPVFFSFDNSSDIRIRSTKVNSFNEQNASPEFEQLTQGLGKPYLEQSYTVTADTLAAIDMARYLDSVGQSKRINFEVTRDSSMVVLEHANVIALGTRATLHPLQNYLASLNFSLSQGEKWVDNAHPLAKEAARYPVQQIGHDRQIEPSIVAILPGQGTRLNLLLLESRHTGALVSMLTSRAGSNEVEAMLRAHGSPKYFEMVVDTECEGNQALRSWPIAVHAYTRPAPTSPM